MKSKKAGVPSDEPPADTRSIVQKIPPLGISRKQFLRDCVGHLMTAGVAMAACIGNDRMVDDLLRLKDQHNRRARS
jgi:hypothetical protein